LASRSGLLGLAAVGVLLAITTLWMGPTPDPVLAPPPRSPPTRFIRPVTAPVSGLAEPTQAPSAPVPVAPADLSALPREEQLQTKNAAAAALGAAIEACNDATPPGFAVIAVITLDDRGLTELDALDGSGAPLDLPELQRCLDATLWDRDWPSPSQLTRFGVMYSGSVE